MFIIMSTEIYSKVIENQNQVFFPNLFDFGIPVQKILFYIPGTDFGIHWYGFLIGIGAILAILFAETQYKKFGLNPDKTFVAVTFGGISALVGARAYYVIFSIDNFKVDGKIDWAEVIDVRDGGMAIYGGLIAGVLAGIISMKIMKIKVLPLLDIAVMGFFIGQSVGRWGNFVNQEAYGSITNSLFAMTSKKIIGEMSGGDILSSNIMVHPCFLYESALCLTGFLFLFFYKKHRKFDGELFLLYLVWYGTGRGFIEGLRTDSLYLSNTGLRVSQVLGFSCAIIALLLIIFIRIKIKKTGNVFYYETEQSIESLEEFNKKMLQKNGEKSVPKDLKESIDNAFDDVQAPVKKQNEDKIEELYEAIEDEAQKKNYNKNLDENDTEEEEDE